MRCLHPEYQVTLQEEVQRREIKRKFNLYKCTNTWSKPARRFRVRHGTPTREVARRYTLVCGTALSLAISVACTVIGVPTELRFTVTRKRRVNGAAVYQRPCELSAVP